MNTKIILVFYCLMEYAASNFQVDTLFAIEDEVARFSEM
jgi:hypothetical protein